MKFPKELFFLQKHLSVSVYYKIDFLEKKLVKLLGKHLHWSPIFSNAAGFGP